MTITFALFWALIDLFIDSRECPHSTYPEFTSGGRRKFPLMAGVDNFPGLAKNTSGRAACPLQPGQPCNLCHPDAYNGPQDCPLVAIVLDDDALREVMHEKRIEHKAEEKIPQP